MPVECCGCRRTELFLYSSLSPSLPLSASLSRSFARPLSRCVYSTRTSPWALIRPSSTQSVSDSLDQMSCIHDHDRFFMAMHDTIAHIDSSFSGDRRACGGSQARSCGRTAFGNCGRQHERQAFCRNATKSSAIDGRQLRRCCSV